VTWNPPATPPLPPQESTSPIEPPPLTTVTWSLWAASGLVALMVVLIVGAGAVIAAGTAVGLPEDMLTAITAGLLSMSYGTVILVAWLLTRASGSRFWPAVGARAVPVATLVVSALTGAVIGRVLAGLWGGLITALDIEISGADVDPTQLFSPGPLGVVFTVLIAVILAPVAEEIVFRGVLLSALERHWGSGIAVGVSSGVFALMHVSPFAIVPIFLFAIVLGVLFLRTRSLTVCIAAHVLFNGVGLALVYAARSAGLL